jgi:hypothetical protein
VETMDRQRLAMSVKKRNTGPLLKSHFREFLIGSALTRRVVEAQDVPVFVCRISRSRAASTSQSIERVRSLYLLPR